ncbi:MFS family permease [Kitasatospora sp. MAA4]|uniref:MFS transporter n=1 Tax=Kitasatospora sp. MAA4 TaxID=3035093 RepID=UPI002476575D|nr:MFS transporter [Kitasatospora sp. MAA4]MDH6132944.1 MFS family permease [Kitasatospora sp. MAA4]
MAVDTSTPVVEQAPPVPKVAWRDVYLLAGMRGLSFAGDIIAATAIALQLQANGASSYSVMALLLAATVPPVLLSPVTGKAADRFDSRTLMVTVGSLQALICVAMTMWTSPAVLIALSVLLSSGLAFTHPVFGALPSAIVGKENVPRASSISQTTAMAGMVAAPGIAGFLISHFGVSVPLWADAVSFTAVVAGGLLIRTRLHKGRGAAAGAGAKTAAKSESSYKVRSDRFLSAVLVLSGAVMAAASIINVLIVFYVRQTFGASEQTYGLIMSAWMLGLLPGGLLVRKVKRFSHEVFLIGSFVCIAVAILGAGLAPSVWWIAPFYFVGGIGNGAQATVTHILLNVRVPDTHRGRAFAALGAVSNTGPAIGYLVGGAIMSFATPRFGFLAAGLFTLVALGAFASRVLRTADSAATDSAPAGARLGEAV